MTPPRTRDPSHVTAQNQGNSVSNGEIDLNRGRLLLKGPSDDRFRRPPPPDRVGGSLLKLALGVTSQSRGIERKTPNHPLREEGLKSHGCSEDDVLGLAIDIGLGRRHACVVREPACFAECDKEWLTGQIKGSRSGRSAAGPAPGRHSPKLRHGRLVVST